MHVFHVFAVTHPLMAALLLFILIPAVLVWIGHSITETGAVLGDLVIARLFLKKEVCS